MLDIVCVILQILRLIVHCEMSLKMKNIIFHCPLWLCRIVKSWHACITKYPFEIILCNRKHKEFRLGKYFHTVLILVVTWCKCATALCYRDVGILVYLEGNNQHWLIYGTLKPWSINFSARDVRGPPNI